MKTKMYVVEFGGETIVGQHLNDAVEMLTGSESIEKMEPFKDEEDTEIKVTIKYMTEEEIDALPEYE